jgi:KDO2-lipid IV(A) lauroyltransferase
MLKRVLRENAVSLLEMPGAWMSKPAVWLPRIETGSAVAEIRRLLAHGKGLIIAAPHLGNWEVGIHFLSATAPITVLYRPPRRKDLEPIMIRGRSGNGARLVPTTPAGVRGLYEALARGEMIAVLPDQQPKKGGAAAFAPFFGVPALTMTLIGRLAAKSGAPVLFVFVARLPEGRYRAYCLHADPEIAATDAESATAALNRGVEECVRLYPDQYQWTYRRFEARPGGAPSPYR